MTELIISGGLLPAALVLLWTAVVVVSMRQAQLPAWCAETPAALAVGGGVGLLAFALIVAGPAGGHEGSAWAMRVCATFAVGATAFAWPLLALRRTRRDRAEAAGFVSNRLVRPALADLGHGHAAGARRT
jgi:hypothetical protein